MKHAYDDHSRHECFTLESKDRTYSITRFPRKGKETKRMLNEAKGEYRITSGRPAAVGQPFADAFRKALASA